MLTEKDCAAIESAGRGLVAFEYAEGIKSIKLNIDGLPQIRFSCMYSNIEAYQEVPATLYNVSWTREVDGRDIYLSESFKDVSDRTNFVIDKLNDLSTEDVELTTEEFYQ